MSNLKFVETYNLVAFLEKPEESDGFEGIIDFLNASSIRYALTMNPIIYTSCIKQFWATAKAKTVNREVQIQALVDGKKVIITETGVRRALQLKDAEGTECLPNATFCRTQKVWVENLTQKLHFYKAFFSPQWKFLIHTILQCLSSKATAWNEFSITMASAIICLATNQKFNFSKYIFDNMVKNLEGGVKFLMYPRRVTPLFEIMMVQAPEELGEGLEMPTDPQHTHPLLFNHLHHIPRRNNQGGKRKDTENESDEDERFGLLRRGTNASKQGRKIADLDADARPYRNESKLIIPRLLQTAVQQLQTAVTRPKAEGLRGKLKTKKEEDNLISWDNTQAMMEADYELAQRLQAEEQGELTIEEISKLFIELIDKRKKHFAKFRAEVIRRKPPTKAQKRNQMCTYLKFMANYKHVVEGSKSQAEGSPKRTREELESDNSKKQKIDENVEAKVNDEAKMKKLMKIVPDDEKLVKAKHGHIRPEEAYERVLWGDLKVMFEPDVESKVWRNLQGYNVTVLKLFSSSGVHFVKF
ncbi:hypothetical protein Tco_0252512 [Tanacetum coccineum]